MPKPLSILVALFGTEGDMRPLLWLAHGMAARGHRITVHVNPRYRSLVEPHGYRVIELATLERFDAAINDPRMFAAEGMRLVLDTMIEALPIYRDSLEAAGERYDLAVGSVLAAGALMWAEHKRIPRIMAYLQPMGLRSAYDCPVYTESLAWLASWPPWMLRPAFWMSDTFGGPFYMSPINRHRKSLGLPPLHCFEDVLRCADALAALFPDWFAAPQPDWPAHLTQFGFPWSPPQAGARLPEEIERFVAHGAPPIVWTHGSANPDVGKLAAIAREASAALDARAIFIGPGGEAGGGVLTVAHAPFELLLPRCRAIVHHGGVGTAMHAFAAGIPQLLVPRAHDQFDNAQRVVRSGAGRRLRYADLTAERAVTGVRTLLGSKDVAVACAAAQARMRADDPLPRLCGFAESLGRQSST